MAKSKGPSLGEFSLSSQMLSDMLTKDDEKREAIDPDTQLDDGEVSERVGGVLIDFDEDGEIKFKLVRLEPLSIKAVTTRIHKLVPKFMKAAKVKYINELSSINPHPTTKITYNTKRLYWNAFLGELIGKLFPTFIHSQYGINRPPFMNLIVKEVVIPAMKTQKDELPELDVEKIEHQFNDILLVCLKKRAAKQNE